MYKLIFVLILLPNISWSAQQITIKAIVGDEIITSYDIEERMKLISFTTNIEFNKKNLSTIKNQIRELLIAEALQLQESKKYDLIINEEKVNIALDNIIQSNNFSKMEFFKLLNNKSIDIESLKKQIRVSLSWQNFILYKIKPLINISDYEIENYYELNNNNENLFEYLLEIAVFPIIDDNNNLAFDIYNKINKKNLSFSIVSKDFIKNSNKELASIWRSKNDLEEEIQDIVANLEINEVSEPIKVNNNYYLILLKDKRFTNINNSRNEVTNKLFMQKLQKKIDSYVSNLKKNYLIEIKS